MFYGYMPVMDRHTIRRISATIALRQILMSNNDPFTAVPALAQLLEYDPSTIIPPPFVQILQSIIIAIPSIAPDEFSPWVKLIRFARLLPSASADADFDKFVVAA
jgi:hypothetical protein